MSRPLAYNLSSRDYTAHDTYLEEKGELDLSKQTYLTSRQAATYMGYTPDKYADPLDAFMAMARRIGSRYLPKLRSGERRVLFARKDLDVLLRKKVGPAQEAR